MTRWTRIGRLALVLLLSLSAPAALAQSSDPAGLVAAMRDAAARLDTDTAEARAREALAQFDRLSPDQLVEVHALLGVILHARDEPVEARRQFEAALSLNPDLSLDPVLVSPVTLAFFAAIRDAVSRTDGPVAPGVVRYVRVPDARPGAALRSLVLPGWGQVHKGETARGRVLAAAWGAGAAATVGAHLARAQARRRYLDAGTSAEAEARYPAYNRWHRARTGLALGMAAVWAVAVVDALARPQPTPAVALRPAVDGLSLRVRL